jgi:hypothetical protein
MRIASAVVVLSLAVVACSPRHGYQPDDQLNVPVRGPMTYVFDNRYPPPNRSSIPDTLPTGVLQREARELPPAPPPPGPDDMHRSEGGGRD